MPPDEPPCEDFEHVLRRRISRRDTLRGLAGLAALGTLGGRSLARHAAYDDVDPPATTLTFAEIAHGSDDRMHVAEGYEARTGTRPEVYGFAPAAGAAVEPC